MLVAAVPASELVKLYEKYKFKLFDLNVRYSLGKTDASRAMAKTLADAAERPLFFAYNNGMTVLCDQFRPSKKGDYLLVTAPQIVNGCQTTVALHSNRDKLDPSVAVLVRFINSKTEELSQHIAESTNTQNAVTHRDLRANDQVQKLIQLRFEKLSPPIKYLRKRGEWRKLSSQEKRKFHIKGNRGPSYRRIENEEIAKAYLAFMGKPIQARTKGKQIFIVQGGFYNEIFDRSRSAEEYVLPIRLLQYVGGKKAEFRRKYEKAMADPSKLTRAQEKKWLAMSVVVYASYTLVGMMGHLVREHYIRKGVVGGYDKDVSSKILADLDGIVKELYRQCSKVAQRYTNTMLRAKPDYNISNAHKLTDTFDDLIADLEIDSDESMIISLP